jgi:hypothetical protein
MDDRTESNQNFVYKVSIKNSISNAIAHRMFIKKQSDRGSALDYYRIRILFETLLTLGFTPF